MVLNGPTYRSLGGWGSLSKGFIVLSQGVPKKGGWLGVFARSPWCYSGTLGSPGWWDKEKVGDPFTACSDQEPE